MKTRIEKDLLGEKVVPADAYWGIHTARALENFPGTGVVTSRALVHALAMVKKAACAANAELGFMSRAKADAISAACDDVVLGKLDTEFPLDALQGGAGTSTNMNMNEVIANRAIEILGSTKGDYRIVHPIDDVNMHQSTNDVYPTALKVAAISAFRSLHQTIASLQGALQRKEKEFAGIVKTGRTEMQPAVPMTLGAEFGAFAEAIGRDRWRTFKCEERLRLVNLGGTAIGTGVTAPRSYVFLVTDKLREITGMGLARGEQVVDQTANADSFVEVSGILKAHASNLLKISNDLRLLNLTRELLLPGLQAGSSIMPAKINPVVPEAVMQIAMKIIANDMLIAEAVSRGTLQISEFLPLVAQALLESLAMANAADTMLGSYVDGIRPDVAVCREHLDHNPLIITAFVPVVGYERAGELVKEFCASNAKNMTVFLEEKLGKDVVAKVLAPERLVGLGYNDHEDHA